MPSCAVLGRSPRVLADPVARKRTPPRISGFLNIDKPPGWTSHDVVAHVRRLTGERQVGHAGTLDPAASGVLPVALGHATKTLPYVTDTDKTYIATVRFGVVTDSADRDGRLLARNETNCVDQGILASAIDAFRGNISQTPPMHSAIKIDGQKLYELARRGLAVDVPSRHVHVGEIELVRWDRPDAVIRVLCSKGTYIRSIARDLGQKLGCGAMLLHLVRVRAGLFSLGSSITVDALEESIARYGWRWIATHPCSMLPDQGVLVLAPEDCRRWQSGMVIERVARPGFQRVYDSRGAWVGMGMTQQGGFGVAPKRVIRGNDQ